MDFEPDSPINTQDGPKRRRTTKEMDAMGMIGSPTDSRTSSVSKEMVIGVTKESQERRTGPAFFLKKNAKQMLITSEQDSLSPLDESTLLGNLSQSSHTSQSTRSPSSSIVSYFSQAKTTSPKVHSVSPVIGATSPLLSSQRTPLSASSSSASSNIDRMDQETIPMMIRRISSPTFNESTHKSKQNVVKTARSPPRGSLEFFFAQKTRETETKNQIDEAETSFDSRPSSRSAESDLTTTTSTSSSSSPNSSFSRRHSDDIIDFTHEQDVLEIRMDTHSSSSSSSSSSSNSMDHQMIDNDNEEMIPLPVRPSLLIDPQNDPLFDAIRSTYV
eukprot:TRINITY_DN2636_c0_g1_i1.p1 TRINITY_DN2636_c0_g1~~TRINITY_DN2636_c0_g1_i1.p1  ORF type:complete len:330 (-),score=90.67 TRINITY_DN2636_c0_g1_i1:394-1383(-)